MLFGNRRIDGRFLRPPVAVLLASLRGHLEAPKPLWGILVVAGRAFLRLAARLDLPIYIGSEVYQQ